MHAQNVTKRRDGTTDFVMIAIVQKNNKKSLRVNDYTGSLPSVIDGWCADV